MIRSSREVGALSLMPVSSVDIGDLELVNKLSHGKVDLTFGR